MEEEIAADAVLGEVRPVAGLGERGLSCLRNALSNLDLVVVLLDIELAGAYVFAGALDELIPQIGFVGIIPLLPYLWVVKVEVPIATEGLADADAFQCRPYRLEIAVYILIRIVDQSIEMRHDLVFMIDAHDGLEGVRMDEMQECQAGYQAGDQVRRDRHWVGRPTENPIHLRLLRGAVARVDDQEVHVQHFGHQLICGRWGVLELSLQLVEEGASLRLVRPVQKPLSELTEPHARPHLLA